MLTFLDVIVHIPFLFVNSSVLYLAVMSAFLFSISFNFLSRPLSWDLIKSRSLDLEFVVTWKKRIKYLAAQLYANIYFCAEAKQYFFYMYIILYINLILFCRNRPLCYGQYEVGFFFSLNMFNWKQALKWPWY